MVEVELLKEEERKLNNLIDKANLIKDKMINELIKIRKQISDLVALEPKYPNDKAIKERLIRYDDLIEKGNNTITDINQEVTKYKDQKNQIQELLEQYATIHNNSSPSLI